VPGTSQTDSVSGLDVRILDRFDDPAISSAAWNDLAARSDTNTVFQTHEWMTSWWDIFGGEHELLLIAVFLEARLVGLAPLMWELPDGATPTLAFIGEGNADYCDFLLAEPRLPVLELIVATLASRRDQWRELRLNNLPETSLTARQLHRLCAENGLLPLSCGRIECPAMVFGEPVAAAESIQHRHSLKRPWRYFHSRGQVEFAELTQPEAAGPQLELFFEQHVQRWRKSSTPSLFANPRNRDFYRKLLARMESTGWLAFSRLTFNGEPLAFHFGFVYGQRYYWYKPSYDIQHRRHSPGTLMLRQLLLQAIERQCRELDFTIGNETFKHRYSNVTRHNVCLMVFPRRNAYLLRRLTLFARSLFKRLAYWRRD